MEGKCSLPAGICQRNSLFKGMRRLCNYKTPVTKEEKLVCFLFILLSVLVETNKEGFHLKKKVFWWFFQDLSGVRPCFFCAQFSPWVQAFLYRNIALPELPPFPQCSHSHVLLSVFFNLSLRGSSQWQGGSHICRLESKFPGNDLSRGGAIRKGPLESDAGTTTAFCCEIKGVRLKLKHSPVNPSEQAPSHEAREPKVLYSPSSISRCTCLPFFLKDISLEVVFEKDIWVHKQGQLV